MNHRLVAMGTAVTLLLAVPVYAGDRAVVEGVVVKVADDGEVIVDLGTKDGLPHGSGVQIYRRVEVVHPVTGKKLVDRFPIGKLVLDDVGKLLSLAQNSESLDRRPAVGDFVVFEPEPEQPVAVVEPEAPTSGPQADPERAAIEGAFAQTLGRPYSERVQVWETFLAEHPQTPFLDQVGKELTMLRAEVARQRAPEGPQEPGEPAKLVSRVSGPKLAWMGDPLQIHVSVAQAGLTESVRLLVRTKGAINYQTVPMTRVGDRAWRAEVPEGLQEPGTLEYFTEIVRTNGELEPVGPGGRVIRKLTVRRPVGARSTDAGRSRASTRVEFVDFKSGDGRDHFTRFESDYRYSIRRGGLDSFRVGIGVFDGVGGSVDDVEGGKTVSRQVNFGFAELTLRFHEYFGVSMLASAGNHHQTEAGTAAEVFGFGGSIRIGEADGTRLDLGASFTDEIGNEAWTTFTLGAIDRVPMSAGVVVTNLPVGEELGVSLELGAAYEVTRWLDLGITTGWNARTINHNGFTAGTSAVLRW
jgi:hypothetical protein